MKFISVLIAALTITSSAIAEEHLNASVIYIRGEKHLNALHPDIATCRFVVAGMKWANMRCDAIPLDQEVGGVAIVNKSFTGILYVDSTSGTKYTGLYFSAEECKVDALRFNAYSKPGYYAWCSEIKVDPAEEWNRKWNKESIQLPELLPIIPGGYKPQ